MTIPLSYLRTNEFADTLGFLLPPAALRIALQRSRAVREIATALRRCEISERMVRTFVNSLASEYQEGKRLSGDLALAALAVALKQIPTDYAEEFLYDLARLRLAEMTTSIRVARECLKNRYLLPRNEVRMSKYSSAKIIPSRTLVPENPILTARARPSSVRYPDFAGAK
jgi:hypothetical protein